MSGAVDAAGPADEVMFILKPSDWDGARDCVVSDLAEMATKVPLVCFGWDRPDHFRFMKQGELEAAGGSVEALRGPALERVRAARTDVSTIDVEHPNGDSIVVTAVGGPFAAERALDQAFLLELEGADKPMGLLVGVPRRGLLMAMDADRPRAMHMAFAAMVQGQFRRSESPPISPHVFLVKRGHFIATLVGDAPSPPRPSAAGIDEAALRAALLAPPPRPRDLTYLVLGGVCVLAGAVSMLSGDSTMIIGLAFLVLAVPMVGAGLWIAMRPRDVPSDVADDLASLPERARQSRPLAVETPLASEPEIDDDAFASALVVRTEAGLRIDAMVGAPEASSVATNATRFVLQLAAKHRWDPEFSGTIRVLVIPTLTPDNEPVRRAMDEAIGALRQTIADRGWRTVKGDAITLSWERGAEPP